MRRFDFNKFYVVSQDPSILEDERNMIIRMQPPGIELVAQYYEKKYQTNISLPQTENLPAEMGVKYAGLQEFVVDLGSYLREIRRTTEDCRHAFLLGATSTHATPVIYIRENGLEGILLADSKGVNAWAAQTATNVTQIPVYAVELPRQADNSSCYTDAMIFCRDTTAINPNTHDYYIPELLTQLRLRAEEREGFFVAKLPNELLKTAQISSFVQKHQEPDSAKKVHKNENLEAFRSRYTDRNVNIIKKNRTGTETISTDIASYARKKGVKLANTIEIQFYLNKLTNQLGDLLTEDKRMEFIAESKRILKSQGPPGPKRQGLHAFAESFLTKHTSHLIKPVVIQPPSSIIEPTETKTIFREEKNERQISQSPDSTLAYKIHIQNLRQLGSEDERIKSPDDIKREILSRIDEGDFNFDSHMTKENIDQNVELFLTDEGAAYLFSEHQKYGAGTIQAYLMRNSLEVKRDIEIFREEKYHLNDRTPP